jgi:predicted permease
VLSLRITRKTGWIKQRWSYQNCRLTSGICAHPSFFLSAAVGALLLIACSNVAGLLLARGVHRTPEQNVRAALGATRRQIVQQLLAESVLISLGASLLGTLVAEGLLHIALASLPADLPRAVSITIDARVLAFALLLGGVTAILFGALPAWRGSKADAASVLRSQSSTLDGGRGRLQSALIIGQVALSLTLVVSAALLVQGFANVLQVNPGIDTEHTLDFGVALTANRYSNAARVAYFHRLLPRLAALPGVRSVSAAFPVPLRWQANSAPVRVPGLPSTPEQMPKAIPVAVEPNYFETLEVPRIAGRTFTSADDDAKSTPVAIINQTFQRRYLPTVADPIGLTITPMLGQAPGPPTPRQIIGIVGDTRSEDTLLPPTPQMYFPYAQASFLQRPEVLMRVVGDPASYQPTISALLRGMDPAAPLFHFHRFRDLRQHTAAQQRFEGLLVSGFAAAAWTLSSVGLYALLAYTVVARTREIAIRLAVGARRGHIVGLILSRSLIPTGLGFLLGLVLSLIAAQAIASQLYRINAYDPRVLLLMAAATITMACCAGALPALRAIRLQPNRILREQ